MNLKKRSLRAIGLMLLAVLLLGGCFGYITGYSGKDAVQEQVRYEISDRKTRAFAASYTWDLDPGHTDIRIADKIEGVPVVGLGGYVGTGVPTPFFITAQPARKELQTGNPGETNWEVPVTWQDLLFTVYVGKNITDIPSSRPSAYFGIETEDGIAFYRPVCYFVCDEENQKLYSKDGILYLRADDTPLKGQESLTERSPSGSTNPADS